MPSKPVPRTSREPAAPVAPSINEMLKALLGEQVEIPPDAVTVEDLAGKAGMSREYIRKLATKKARTGEWKRAMTFRGEGAARRKTMVYWPA